MDFYLYLTGTYAFIRAYELLNIHAGWSITHLLVAFWALALVVYGAA
jgi:hypothetical protein